MQAFSETYREARAKFLTASKRVGAQLRSYRHEHEVGPDGEALLMDVAVVGEQTASKMLVVGSGTHGIEGFPGSAVQTHWLNQFDPASFPPDVKVVLTHGHNPWGFAHGLRFTEENVDLNRNFVDFAKGAPSNPDYNRVHSIIAREHWVDEDLPGVFAKLSDFREEVGEQAYSDAFNGGQYSHADGIFYGGTREQWSSQAFRRAILDDSAGVKSAAIIDLHTGIGPRNGHIFLCFHQQGSLGYERARTWWG